jgi:hypothetical protein
MSLSAPWTTRRNRKLADLSPLFRYPDFPRPLGSIAPLHQLLAKLLRTGVFNMADVAIIVGAGLFVLGELGRNQKSGTVRPRRADL